MSDQDPLRICLLLGGETIPKWFFQSLKPIFDREDFEVSLLLFAETPTSESPGLVADIYRKKSWTIVAALQKISKIIFGPPTYAANQDVESIQQLENVQRHRTTTTPSGEYGLEFSDEAVQMVSEMSDIVVHFGVGILRGDILDAPTHGIIGYHHGDLRAYRGGPPGFWEFTHGQDKTGVTIQRFNENLDAGAILAFESVDIRDARKWREVRRRQCDAAKPLLVTALENTRDPEFEAETPELGPIYSTDQRDWKITVKYIFREIMGLRKCKPIKALHKIRAFIKNR